MRQHPCWFLPVLIIAILLARTPAWSTQDSTRTTSIERTLFIGHLDFNCFPDTVKGSRSGERGEGGYLPRRILWGGPRPGHTDSNCSGSISQSKQLKETIIQYPDWTVHDGSVSFPRINPDSLADMVLHLQASIQQQDGKIVDTLRSICIFGQHAFDSVSVIHLGEIGRFQASPYFAMELVRGSEMTRPATRDLSGSISYILEPITLVVNRREISPSPAAPLAGVHTEQGTVQVYPNPTGNTIRLEASGLPAGEYHIQVVSVNGQVVLREPVVIEHGNSLQRTLDVQQIPNGYHVVRIENSDGKNFGLYPIIITR